MIMTGVFLFRFTPSLMEREALEAIFVQRQDMVQRVLDLIRESALTASKHHTLLIGPRGIGKTHLVSLIYHRAVAMEDLRDRLLIAWMREEEWGITSLLDLLLRIFRALVAEYKDAALDERVESLYSLPPDHVEVAAGKLLKEYVGDRTLLVLIENLDDIFHGLSDEGQKRLRAYIQENPFFTIVATAQSLFNGVSLQTSPFYGFFRIQHLEGLSIEESTELLANIARYRGDQELASFIKTPTGRARIRAVNHLAGGNHRVYVIFSQFLTRESLDELVEPFMRMLDDLTPYYQDRMRWLSQQQRKIVEFLLNRRSPATVKEIAQRCFMTHQTASSQLKSLREMEYVQSISLGRESYYELREPLMRLCIEVKKHQGEMIRLLVDFLRFWYSQVELQQRLAMLPPEAALERQYVLYALREADEAEDPRVAACLRDYTSYVEQQDFEGALRAAEDLVEIRGHAQDWIDLGWCLSHLGQFNEALSVYNKAIDLDPKDILAWTNRSSALYKLKCWGELLVSAERAIELAPDSVVSWDDRGTALAYLGRWREALESFNKASELAPNDVDIWNNKSWALTNLKRWDEALALAEKAIQLDPQHIRIWYNRGNALSGLGQWEEALSSFNTAIELAPDFIWAWINKGWTLYQLGRWEEALASFNKALELSPDNALIWERKGLVLRRLGRQEEALTCMDKAFELTPEDGEAWNERAVLLYEEYQRLEAALTCLDKAVELKKNDPTLWSNRGVALSSVGRHEEALQCFDQAIELNASASYPYFSFNRAAALMALSRWDEGIAQLDAALRYLADTKRIDTGDEVAIVPTCSFGRRTRPRGVNTSRYGLSFSLNIT